MCKLRGLPLHSPSAHLCSNNKYIHSRSLHVMSLMHSNKLKILEVVSNMFFHSCKYKAVGISTVTSMTFTTRIRLTPTASALIKILVLYLCCIPARLLQPYGNGKPCVTCGGMMTRGTRTSHWEGGLGCRNKAKMSR